MPSASSVRTDFELIAVQIGKIRSSPSPDRDRLHYCGTIFAIFTYVPQSWINLISIEHGVVELAAGEFV